MHALLRTARVGASMCDTRVRAWVIRRSVCDTYRQRVCYVCDTRVRVIARALSLPFSRPLSLMGRGVSAQGVFDEVRPTSRKSSVSTGRSRHSSWLLVPACRLHLQFCRLGERPRTRPRPAARERAREKEKKRERERAIEIDRWGENERERGSNLQMHTRIPARTPPICKYIYWTHTHTHTHTHTIHTHTCMCVARARGYPQRRHRC